MMDKTYLYVCFHEYGDDAAQATGFFKLVDYIDASKEVAYLEKLFEKIDFFKYERLLFLYDSENVRATLTPYIVLKKDLQKQKYPDVPKTLRAAFKRRGFSDFRKLKAEDDGEKYTYNGNDVRDSIVADSIRRKAQVLKDEKGRETHFTSVIYNADALDDDFAYNHQLETSYGRKVDFAVVSSVKELYEWLSVNRLPKRFYCYNAKHGDASHKAQMISYNHRAAQLETDEITTQKLLDFAVGKDQSSALWLYDAPRGKFIYFENQGEIRLAFHGYHIQKGDENYDNIDMVKLREIGNIE